MKKQEFTIKENATLPLLVMKLNKEPFILYENFHTLLADARITFSMRNQHGANEYRISNKPAFLLVRDNGGDVEKETEYYIYYRFTSKDTNKFGRYKGEFKIEFGETDSLLKGILVAPVTDNLYINIIPSIF